MNDKELDRRKRELRIKKEQYREQGGGTYRPLPFALKAESDALSCIDMINSLLCYQCRGWTDPMKVIRYMEASPYNYLSPYIRSLGEEVVANLIRGQMNSIQGIKQNVFCDDEGLTYNEIVWREQ